MKDMIRKYLKCELLKQQNSINLIASENYASRDVLDACGSVLSNKYSEGLPYHRYYSGNEYIDYIESIAISRCKKLFNCDCVNVQPHSGSQANMAAYMSLVNVSDKIVSMSLDSGGHLTHGAKSSFSSKFYNFSHYSCNKEGFLDMSEVESVVKKVRPKLIVCGYSSYPRLLDFRAFKEIADSYDAFLMADIAHIAGLVAAKVIPSPIKYCDVVTATTHKTLRGPRGAIIMCKEEFREKVDRAVFPGCQGGPMENVIAAKAICFREAMLSSFVKYSEQVIKNASALAKGLNDFGFDLVTKGTSNHMLLVDLKNLNITGSVAQDELEVCNIFTNKNVVVGDSNVLHPSGLRLGTPAMTTRSMKEFEMFEISDMIFQAIVKKKLKQVLSRVRSLSQRFKIYNDIRSI